MRRPRHDAPDTWHHVMNRGIARRTVLETDADRRFFLSLLAREVRAGRLEIHAYSLMLTHFHLLVRSPKGELSDAMRRIQNRFSRRFNRTRRRDGPLFRGRFLSRPIDSLRYRRRVLTYIHDNAVAAGLCADPASYEWSSASHLSRGTRPKWLSTSWVDRELAARGGGRGRREALESAFPSQLDEDFRRWVEAQLHARLPDEMDDASLKHAGSPRVVRWTIRKARLADGTRPWRPFCPPNLVERVVARFRAASSAPRGRRWAIILAGMLRTFAGCVHREIGLRVSRDATTVCRYIQGHRRLIDTLPGYEALVAQVGHAILDAR